MFKHTFVPGMLVADEAGAIVVGEERPQLLQRPNSHG